MTIATLRAHAERDEHREQERAARRSGSRPCSPAGRTRPCRADGDDERDDVPRRAHPRAGLEPGLARRGCCRPLTISSSAQTTSPAATSPGKSPGPKFWPGIVGNDCTCQSTAMPSSQQHGAEDGVVEFHRLSTSGRRAARRRHFAMPRAFITTPMSASPFAMNFAKSSCVAHSRRSRAASGSPCTPCCRRPS